jgi:hypothetical protein
MVKKTFSVPGARKPEHLIYDSDCNALKEVEARHDDWFVGVGMCMDAVKYSYPLRPSCTIPQSIGEIARYVQVIWQ